MGLKPAQTLIDARIFSPVYIRSGTQVRLRSGEPLAAFSRIFKLLDIYRRQRGSDVQLIARIARFCS
jgi:hypothetical protein